MACFWKYEQKNHKQLQGHQPSLVYWYQIPCDLLLFPMHSSRRAKLVVRIYEAALLEKTRLSPFKLGYNPLPTSIYRGGTSLSGFIAWNKNYVWRSRKKRVKRKGNIVMSTHIQYWRLACLNMYVSFNFSSKPQDLKFSSKRLEERIEWCVRDRTHIHSKSHNDSCRK